MEFSEEFLNKSLVFFYVWMNLKNICSKPEEITGRSNKNYLERIHTIFGRIPNAVPLENFAAVSSEICGFPSKISKLIPGGVSE